LLAWKFESSPTFRLISIGVRNAIMQGILAMEIHSERRTSQFARAGSTRRLPLDISKVFARKPRPMLTNKHGPRDGLNARLDR
jgi:hypothetical protein